MNTPNNYNDTDTGDDDLEYREEWLSAYLDDELNAAQRALVEQRIVDDEQAAVMLQDLMRVRSLVGSLPAWSGNSISIADVTRKHAASFSEELVVLDDGEENEDPLVHQANAQGNDGDYHNELNPDTPSQLASASIERVLERDIAPDFSRVRRAGLPTGGANAWLRPALLAASLLFALGFSLLLWPSSSPWSVATSTGERAPAKPSEESNAALIAPSSNEELAMESDASAAGMPAQGMAAPIVNGPELAVDNAAPELATPFSKNELSESRARTSGSNIERAESQLENENSDVLSRSGTPPKPSSPSPKPESRNDFAESAKTVVPEQSLPRKAKDMPAPGAAARIPAQSKALLNASNDKATPASAPLQMARSSAWTDSDLGAGLIRLSQFFSFSPTMKPSGISNEPRLSESRAGSTSAPATDYPIAIVTSKRPEREGSQLTTLLQQNSFGLAGISNAGSAVEVPGQVPFGAATGSIPSTIVLFVDRGLAQQILQAAAQTGEIIGKPVWINSIDDRDTANNAAQKVVLLFSPR